MEGVICARRQHFRIHKDDCKDDFNKRSQPLFNEYFILTLKRGRTVNQMDFALFRLHGGWPLELKKNRTPIFFFFFK